MLKWKQVTDELVCLINTNIYSTYKQHLLLDQHKQRHDSVGRIQKQRMQSFFTKYQLWI
ncbi:unnamed protein product [Brassica oleracea]